ncbi:MAG: N-acetylmuramoyl-L-alanine amidase [Phycisphaerae bacterium]|nr:N-acetylmuramoyl-L-alanine amidase [Phycisphaerae bacterium]
MPSGEWSRREALRQGGLLGLFLLAGCQQNQRVEALPAPVRPGGAATPPMPPYRPGPPIARRPGQPGYTPGGGGPVPDVLPRAAWTRQGVASTADINPMLPIGRITIHHDGMDGFTSTSQADAAARLETIRRAHVNQRGYADIGYHYIVDPGGRVWEGRNIRYQGAHVKDNNEGNVGVMCLGNFDLHRPSSAQIAALDRFVAGQMRRHNVGISRVYTHQEINPTACPGRNLQQYMVATRGNRGAMRLALIEMGGSALA